MVIHIPKKCQKLIAIKHKLLKDVDESFEYIEYSSRVIWKYIKYDYLVKKRITKDFFEKKIIKHEYSKARFRYEEKHGRKHIPRKMLNNWFFDHILLFWANEK